MVIDDDDSDFPPQPVEGFEQLLYYGWSEALEGLIEQQYPHVARKRAGHRNHLLFAAREIIRWAVEPLSNPREIFVDAIPSRAFCADELPISSLSESLIDPCDAGAMPTSVFSRVDLPAPLRPSSAMISFSCSVKLTSLRMWLLP